MSWQWEDMTSPDFAEAVKSTGGVCLVPIGVVERHGTHLPLGNDLHIVREVALRVAEREPAVVFPPFYLSQVQEAKNRPGAIALSARLILDLLEEICSEIARNGLRKIVLLNGHGGNEHLLSVFLTTALEKPHNYTLYLLRLAEWWGLTVKDEGWRQMMQSDFDFHAGEQETSFALAARPDLVHMDRISPPSSPLGRAAHLPRRSVSTSWVADFPDHYTGDATHATVEKGEYLMALAVEHLTGVLKAIKQDSAAEQLQSEFLEESEH